MSLDILGIGQSALSAFQVGVAISSKNIADSGDPDYSREMVEYTTLMGGDVHVDIKRISDHFLASQVNLAQSDLGATTESSSILSGIDQMLTGLNGSDSNGPYNLLDRNMQNFFDSLSNLSTSVTNASRQNVVSQANLLSNTINTASSYLDQQKGNADQKIGDAVSQVNDLAKQIAKINDKIQRTLGNPSPDLLDQRDKLVGQLSQYVGVSSVEKNGMVDVSLANGTSLVNGTQTSVMSIGTGEYGDQKTILVNGDAVLSPQNLSGSLGGLMNTRNNIIPAIQQKLGVFTATLITAFNAQNQQGYVSPNTHGGNIFQPIQASGIADPNNQGNASLSAQIDPQNLANLKPTSYSITEIAAGQYQVTDLGTNTQRTFTSFPINVDGLQIAQSGSMHVGDSFKVDPFSTASSALSVTAGPNDIAVSSTADATGNGNINALAGLSSKQLFGGGTQTFAANLADTFSLIGQQSSQANSDYNAAKITLTQATNDKQSVSGVSTQEEYTNIIHFQQSYSAAAKIISVDQQMFTSVLSAMGE